MPANTEISKQEGNRVGETKTRHGELEKEITES